MESGHSGILPQTQPVCKVQNFFVASREAFQYQRSISLQGNGRLELQPWQQQRSFLRRVTLSKPREMRGCSLP